MPQGAFPHYVFFNAFSSSSLNGLHGGELPEQTIKPFVAGRISPSAINIGVTIGAKDKTDSDAAKLRLVTATTFTLCRYFK